MARDDAGLLVVAGSVAGELEDLGREVLEDRREVDRGTTADALGVAALLQVRRNAPDRDLESGLGRPRGRLAALGLAASTFTFARHVVVGGC